MFDDTITRWPGSDFAPVERKREPQAGAGVVLAVLVGGNILVWGYVLLRAFL